MTYSAHYPRHPVLPHFFKSRLNDILCILLIPKVFQDKPVNIIGIKPHAVVIFSVGDSVIISGKITSNSLIAIGYTANRQ